MVIIERKALFELFDEKNRGDRVVAGILDFEDPLKNVMINMIHDIGAVGITLQELFVVRKINGRFMKA